MVPASKPAWFVWWSWGQLPLGEGEDGAAGVLHFRVGLQQPSPVLLVLEARTFLWKTLSLCPN